MITDTLEATDVSKARLEALQSKVQELSAPAVLNPADPRNPIIADKRAMESLFAVCEEHNVLDPKRLTEFELYSRLEDWAKKVPDKS